MVKCPNCGYDLDNSENRRVLRECEISPGVKTPRTLVRDNSHKDTKEKDRKEAEDIFTLLIEGKKKEIERRYGRK